ncbi:MAG: DUF4907 domain-containing protein [Rhizobacter sp.]|nr:DUF4907 domain-containing protein [Ferruginibacter sp.]
MKQHLFLLGLTLIACCNHPRHAVKNGDAAVKETAEFTSLIFNNDTLQSPVKKTGFGYNIFRNGKLYIHQPVIPAVGGNNGFTREAHAQKTAALVIDKIKRNIVPPSLSLEELDSIKVVGTGKQKAGGR